MKTCPPHQIARRRTKTTNKNIDRFLVLCLSSFRCFVLRRRRRLSITVRRVLIKKAVHSYVVHTERREGSSGVRRLSLSLFCQTSFRTETKIRSLSFQIQCLDHQDKTRAGRNTTIRRRTTKRSRRVRTKASNAKVRRPVIVHPHTGVSLQKVHTRTMTTTAPVGLHRHATV